MCNATTDLEENDDEESAATLQCYYGSLPEQEASFIPTTTVLPVDDDPRFWIKENENSWVPEPLTIPPDTEAELNEEQEEEEEGEEDEEETTTTEAPDIMLMEETSGIDSHINKYQV